MSMLPARRELVVCASCRRHVHGGERRCPFCAANLGAPAGLHRPTRTRIQLGRVLLVVGTGLVACTSGPPNTDVQGGCTDAFARCDGPVVSTEGTHPACACGSGGRCQKGRCVSCDCADYQWCDQDNGKCIGDPPSDSKGACYGCPPMLA
jgi:hypothetical protein